MLHLLEPILDHLSFVGDFVLAPEVDGDEHDGGEGDEDHGPDEHKLIVADFEIPI